MAKLLEIDQSERQDVADAFLELANAGQLGSDVIDEVVPRLLPELYSDIQDWYSASMSVEEAQACSQVLANLAANDRISERMACGARAHLGILAIAAAA